MRRKYGHDLEERAVSGTTPSTDNKSESSRMNTYSDRDSTSGSELSELAIHTLLVETRARNLDREVYQDPDSDRYLIPSERVFDNAADDLETIAVSKRSISLLPQKEVVRTDLQPFQQETQPLAKIWCVKMEEDTHQPNELNSQMRIMKTYLKARYRLSDLLRAQRNDRMTSNDQYVDSKTRMSNDVSIGQWNGFRRRAYERAYETVTSRSGSLHDIPPSDEWLSGKTE